ncbi:MAG: hypothetical protein ACRCZ2_02165 [Fusobacteriaceae bacterium]
MNDNVMLVMKQFFGEERMNNMLNQWNGLSDEMKNIEMQKINGMSKEQQIEYLKRQGVDVSKMQTSSTGRKFSY